MSRRLLFLYLCTALLLILVWFKDGKMMATGEEGITLYNPSKTFSLYSSVWLETGTGYILPVVLPRAPLYFFAQFLVGLGFTNVTVQAILLYLFLSIGLIGFYLLARELLKKDYRNYLIYGVAAFFYFFNLYSLIQVWGRFLYTQIAGWALLPIFTYFQIKFIRENRIIFTIAASSVSLILSMAYGAPSYIVTIWFPTIIFFLFEILSGISLIKKILSIFLSGFIWLVFHFWWLFPYLTLSSEAFSKQSGPVNNLSILGGLSKYFKPDSVIFLREGYYGENLGSLWSYYGQVKYLILSLLIFVIVILGILISRKIRSRKYLFFILVATLFVVKGLNPPFGREIFSFLFNTFPFLGVFRNPFEKFGLVVLIPYSIFFALGVFYLYQKGRWQKILVNTSLIVAFVMVWPFWTGRFIQGSVKIEVPDYYKSANVYLNELGNQRLFHLPYLNGDGIRYSWGYRGLEPSEFIFDRESISKSLRTSRRFDDFYLGLKPYLEQESFSNILYTAGVSNVIFHKDVDESWANEAGMDITEQNIKNWRNLKFEKEIGLVRIYSLDKSKVVPRIYAVSKAVVVEDPNDVMGEILNSDFEPLSFVVTESNEKLSNWTPNISFEKINTMSYKVSVTGSKGNFILILANTYSDQWRAWIDKKQVLNHFVVNGFSNGWLIEEVGDFSIDLILKVWPWE